MAKIKVDKYDSEIFIAKSSSTSHMVNSEENMTNILYKETLVTISDCGSLTKKMRGLDQISETR